MSHYSSNMPPPPPRPPYPSATPYATTFVVPSSSSSGSTAAAASLSASTSSSSSSLAPGSNGSNLLWPGASQVNRPRSALHLASASSPNTATTFNSSTRAPPPPDMRFASSFTSSTAVLPTTEQLEHIAAKSCLKCRDRKVKCDRIYPSCGRCIKREESCEYKAGMVISTRCRTSDADDSGADESEGDGQPSQSAPTSVSQSYVYTRHGLSTPPTAPIPTSILYAPQAPPFQFPSTQRPIASLPQRNLTTNLASTFNANNWYKPAAPVHPVPSFNRAAYRLQSAALPVNGSSKSSADHPDVLASASQWGSLLVNDNIGEGSIDWQLARPTMAYSLQRHLLDASMDSCCSHLAAFRPFASRVQYFKQHIEELDLPSQVIVSVLVSLGARASPHSALLGIPGVDVESGRTPLSLVLSAGERRESAWRAIASRAVELCSRPEIIQVPSKENVESLVAISSMLKLCETRPTRARYFIRNVVGMFEDLQASSGMSAQEVQELKNAVGPTVYESDARVAAYLSMPVIISDAEVGHYFDGTNIAIPDLAQASLMDDLRKILDPARGPLDRLNFDEALGLAAYYVCSIQRCYAGIAYAPQSSMAFLASVPQLWTYIDSAHGAVQHLHRTLIRLDLRDDYGDHAIEYDLLIAVRMDTRLIDIINLTHAFLCRQLEREWAEGDRHALQQLVALSERRVRKALKLLSFYAKIFHDSRDKHLVYHLFLQLDVLPSWVDMAPQRVGEATAFGPLNQESALSEQELDWLTRALELACFYTPQAGVQLGKITRGRDQRRVVEMPSYRYDLAPAEFHSSNVQSSSASVDSGPSTNESSPNERMAAALYAPEKPSSNMTLRLEEIAPMAPTPAPPPEQSRPSGLVVPPASTMPASLPRQSTGQDAIYIPSSTPLPPLVSPFTFNLYGSPSSNLHGMSASPDLNPRIIGGGEGVQSQWMPNVPGFDSILSETVETGPGTSTALGLEGPSGSLANQASLAPSKDLFNGAFVGAPNGLAWSPTTIPAYSENAPDSPMMTNTTVPAATTLPPFDEKGQWTGVRSQW